MAIGQRDNFIYVQNGLYTTPARGLKIRFEREAMEPVIAPLRAAGEYPDVLRDLELWIKLPNALSSVAAITAAFATGSWMHVLLFWFLGLLVGGIFQEVIYSEALKVIFPMFLGGWLIALPATAACDIYLVGHGHYLTAVILTLLVVGNWLHKTDWAFLLPLMPFSLWTMSAFERRTGMRVGFTLTERLFVLLCYKRAQRMGIELRWELYDQAVREEREAWMLGKLSKPEEEDDAL
jgi:hypothetical protein